MNAPNWLREVTPGALGCYAFCMRYVLTLMFAVAAAGCNSGIVCDSEGSARCPGQPNNDGSEDVQPVCVVEDCSGDYGIRRVMCGADSEPCAGREQCMHVDDIEALWYEIEGRCN